MNRLQRPRVNNMGVLNHLATLDPLVAAQATQFRGRQREYFSKTRDPNDLLPIAMPGATAISLRERYGAARVGDQLAWINRMRNEHELNSCPMCGGTGVAALDHVLPKSHYPEFAIFSFNLVPTCDACNRRRLNKGAKFHFVHPYFDHALLQALRLEVRFRSPFDAVRFSLSAVEVAGKDLQRVNDQLAQTLPLLVFRRQMRARWNEWHRRFRKDAKTAEARVLDDLEIFEETARNSWDCAFLWGLAGDDKAMKWMVATPPA